MILQPSVTYNEDKFWEKSMTDNDQVGTYHTEAEVSSPETGNKDQVNKRLGEAERKGWEVVGNCESWLFMNENAIQLIESTSTRGWVPFRSCCFMGAPISQTPNIPKSLFSLGATFPKELNKANEQTKCISSLLNISHLYFLYQCSMRPGG